LYHKEKVEKLSPVGEFFSTKLSMFSLGALNVLVSCVTELGLRAVQKRDATVVTVVTYGCGYL
ncbi:hypothetical protein, partial [Streptococcus acidominimus]|uniref:hypothetical protein n=1 Tax=Streptococcus acidominimus TaxID=1326 RepID=UPI001D16979D